MSLHCGHTHLQLLEVGHGHGHGLWFLQLRHFWPVLRVRGWLHRGWRAGPKLRRRSVPDEWRPCNWCRRDAGHRHFGLTQEAVGQPTARRRAGRGGKAVTACVAEARAEQPTAVIAALLVSPRADIGPALPNQHRPVLQKANGTKSWISSIYASMYLFCMCICLLSQSSSFFAAVFVCHLSVYVSFHLRPSICVSICMSLRSVCRSVHRLVGRSVSRSVGVFLSLSAPLSIPV